MKTRKTKQDTQVRCLRRGAATTVTSPPTPIPPPSLPLPTSTNLFLVPTTLALLNLFLPAPVLVTATTLLPLGLRDDLRVRGPRPEQGGRPHDASGGLETR